MYTVYGTNQTRRSLDIPDCDLWNSCIKTGIATDIPALAILPTRLAREVTKTAVQRSQNGQRKGSPGESVGVGWRWRCIILRKFNKITGLYYGNSSQQKKLKFSSECVITFGRAAVGVVFRVLSELV